MTDLTSFYIGSYTWGENYLSCLECGWSSPEDQWETLADLVRLAEAHTCTVTVEGELTSKAISG